MRPPSSHPRRVLDDPGDLDVERVVVGDAASPEVVTDALHRVDAVIHLAAIPGPTGHEPERVFSTVPTEVAQVPWRDGQHMGRS